MSNLLRRLQRVLVASAVVVSSTLGGGVAAADQNHDAAGDAVSWVVLERAPDGTLTTSVIELPANDAPQLAAAVMDGTFTIKNDGVVATNAFRSSAAASVVLVIEPEIELHAFGDPYREFQWGLDRTTFAAASSQIPNEDDVVVAVLDTGIRGTHEDLDQVLVAGSDFVSGTGDGLVPDNFHGSHVAGVIGATINNDLGIEGAGAGIRIMPVRVLNSSGSGSSGSVAAGIIWAADNGADVINLSLGSTQNSSVVEAAIDHAISKGTVIVAASGNSGTQGNPTMYPAALDDVISVGAIDTDDSKADFSGYGNWVDVVAPGVSILSLHNGGDDSYAYANGTSMASPYVAAAAGLLKAVDPDITPAQVLDLLRDTAEDLGAVGDDNLFGAGLVDPANAVEVLLGGGTQTDGGSTPPAPTAPTAGYSLVTSLGRVLAQGSATSVGSLDGIALQQPIVTAATTPSGNGYWMAGSDGGIFAFGDAPFLGSTGAIALNQPIVGMAPTTGGNGYWLVASDGGIFAYGDAPFLGSTGGISLSQPIVGMAPTTGGNGYWLVASDGGIFAYGDALYVGSGAGQLTAGEIVVSMISVTQFG
ncbi:MAG: S8 family serine peptidase [Actinobacteria bacterium]|nr:S8 family serine peptidase [Actinomycetota bacterium]